MSIFKSKVKPNLDEDGQLIHAGFGEFRHFESLLEKVENDLLSTTINCDDIVEFFIKMDPDQVWKYVDRKLKGKDLKEMEELIKKNTSFRILLKNLISVYGDDSIYDEMVDNASKGKIQTKNILKGASETSTFQPGSTYLNYSALIKGSA